MEICEYLHTNQIPNSFTDGCQEITISVKNNQIMVIYLLVYLLHVLFEKWNGRILKHGNPFQVQRLLTIRDLKGSQRSLWIQWPILACLSLLTTLGGIYMFAFYVGCDPVTSKRIERPDQLLPLIVVDTMSQYPGDLMTYFFLGRKTLPPPSP